MKPLVEAVEWAFFAYFIGINFGYMGLNLLSMIALSRLMQNRLIDDLPITHSDLETPISLLMPAYNEEASIASSVRSLLQLNYSKFEIIVINDGSKDGTLDVLMKEFMLVPFQEAIRQQIRTQTVHGDYRSTRHDNLRVIDKANGGKADALNAGINSARYPLFCAVDADSILQRDSLQRVVRPFMEDASVVASGGSIRIANGCEVKNGFLRQVGLPKKLLPLLQIVEYLRAFLFGRMGWSPINAMLIISGAFGLFRKEAVVAVGGYRTDTVGEDMELIVRMHRILKAAGRKYRIVFVPDPICWTEAPEDMATLRNQRIRWQRGLLESMDMNMGLLLHPRSGAVGWVAFPFMLIFEAIGPIIELSGYLFALVFFLMGMISGQAFFAFLLVAIGFGIMLSISALLLEEITFHVYARPGHFLLLLSAALFENFGYRQINTWWRVAGIVRWMRGGKGSWGEMKRSGSWQSR